MPLFLYPNGCRFAQNQMKDETMIENTINPTVKYKKVNMDALQPATYGFYQQENWEYKTYDLKAVIVHTGTITKEGHYIAYIQHLKKWYRIDDSQVRSLVAAYTYFCYYHKPA